jgi:MerR family copper efflux transcriptional regulator
VSEQLFRIGELAARAGVSARTVDYYTTLGLLTPAERTPANYRLYDPSALDRIAAIRRLEAHGVSLDDIAKALRDNRADIPALLQQLDHDLHALQTAAHTAGPEAHGLLAAITARAHSLITTALEIASGVPPPQPIQRHVLVPDPDRRCEGDGDADHVLVDPSPTTPEPGR